MVRILPLQFQTFHTVMYVVDTLAKTIMSFLSLKAQYCHWVCLIYIDKPQQCNMPDRHKTGIIIESSLYTVLLYIAKYIL